ncbi:MAG: sensor histidine kinase [Myxococcales bacterium]|nr:sensor histidine kinase [Myxococcales bacterium]
MDGTRDESAEAAEARWIDRTLLSRCRGAARVVLFFTVIAAPLDVWLLPTWRETSLALSTRASAVGVVGGMLWAARGATWGPRAWPAINLATVGLSAFAGHRMAQMGGADAPWVYYGYILPIWCTPMPIGRGPRAVALVSTAVAFWLGVLWVRPEVLTGRAAGTIVGAMAFSLALHGLLGDLLRRTELAAVRDRWLRESKELELEAANEHLADRVRSRTRELQKTLRRLENVREAERRSMAMTLHDELGQEVTALRLRMAGTVEGPARAAVDAGLEHLHERVRDAVRQLRPRLLETLGFEAALHALVQQVTSPGLKVDLDQRGPLDRVPAGVALDAYRTLQEALTNVVRHARARHVTVLVDVLEDRLHLRVDDDGRGLPAVRTPQGLGLTSIEDRTRARGGTLDLGPRPGRGTRVDVLLPFEMEETL